jgi:hypothetical protein
METLSPWNELLGILGRTVVDTGKTLNDKRSTLSIDELMDLSNALKNCAIVLDQRIDSLLEENQ